MRLNAPVHEKEIYDVHIFAIIVDVRRKVKPLIGSARN